MRTFFILTALTVLVVTLIWMEPQAHSFTIPDDLTTSELRVKLARDIALDASLSYQAFKERYNAENFETTHGAAHLFGEMLFEIAGVSNILVCDTDMNFGCFHGFVRAAVGALGLDAIGLLDDTCLTLGPEGAPVCQHGIGHGILEYLGHERLIAALDACASLNQPDPLAGCSGGVFMEYNVPFTIGERGEFSITARPLTDAENPYTPCDTLSSDTFVASCYHELAQWWKQVYPEDYAMYGKFCDAVPDRAYKEACMAGIAKVIPQAAAYDVEGSRALCALLPDDAYGPCIVQAAWAIRANERDHERARALCAFAPDDLKQECPA